MAKKKKNATRKKVTTKATTDAVAKPKYKGTCFVMMPFEEPFLEYYDGVFDPAIRKAKLEPVRADDLFRPGVIASDMWQMIQDARVLLAELTSKNANVFYELGLAHAIGKPVILLARKMDDVPFDLRQLRVLLYDRDHHAWGLKLSKGITKAINETLKSPIEAVPLIYRKTVESQAPEQDALAARVERLESKMRMSNARPSPVGTNRHLRELEAITTPGRLSHWIEKWRGSAVPITELVDLAGNKWEELEADGHS